MPIEIPPISKSDFQPIASSNFGRRTGAWVTFLLFWIAAGILFVINYFYFMYAYNSNPWLFLLIPLSVFGTPWEFSFLVAGFVWIILQILRWIEPVKEGTFPLDGREFKFYCYRYYICYFTFYFFRATGIPWADMVAFRMFGVKVGKNVVLYDSWVDMELIEIGDYVMLSLNAALLSHCIYNNKFIVGKVVIKKNAIIGAESVVPPGCVIEEGAILGACCSCMLNQHLEGYCSHIGNPATKSIPIKISEKPTGEPQKDNVSNPKKEDN
jgi:acetyltransferase-like isoleucine patch superfamily enzyme